MKYTMLSLNKDMIMNYMLNFSKVKIYTITGVHYRPTSIANCPA